MQNAGWKMIHFPFEMVPFQVLQCPVHVSGIHGNPFHLFGASQASNTINGEKNGPMQILVIRVTITSHLDPSLHLSRLAAVPLGIPSVVLGKLCKMNSHTQQSLPPFAPSESQLLLEKRHIPRYIDIFNISWSSLCCE